MNVTLKTLTVLPLYGQVSVQDRDAQDLPEWQSGDEPFVASSQCILIATPSDTEGDVIMRICEGPDGTGLGTEVFNGSISVDSGVLEFGSITAGDLERLNLAMPGDTQLRVFTLPHAAPAIVTVLLAVGASAAGDTVANQGPKSGE